MELVRPATAMLSRAVARSPMHEDEFRVFYERTARPLRAYLYRMLNGSSAADDILQESYLRFLQARIGDDMSSEHRKNYLFRIATNLLHDHAASRKPVSLGDYPWLTDVGEQIADRKDWAGYLQQLVPRQRELLWLAYVEGMNHKEIAEILGVKVGSIRPMLSRARERLSEILKAEGCVAHER